MTAVAAFLALALAASPSTPPRRTGLDLSNSARARAGLLPRKPARTREDVRGRRLLTIKAPSPTYLAEPAPLAEDAREAEVEPIAATEAAPVDDGIADRDGERVAARGRVVTVRLPPTGTAPEAAEDPPAIAPPEEVGALRVAALGVETEVTLRMRFDP
jgi:hypothetical protein